jgi:hypothetical protein
MAKRKKDEAEVDVGLPIPIPSGGVLDPRMATTMPPIDRGIVVSGPVQSGLNNAVEAKTMNPVMMWLASQGVDVAAEKTGVKDVLRDRAAGLLDLFGLGEAQAAEAVDMPPAQTGFSSPAPAQPIEAPLQPSEPAPAPVVASDVALGNPVPESMEAPLYNRPASEEYVRNVPTENEQAFQLASYYSRQGIDSPKKLGEAATQNPGILNSIKGFLGDEEKMLRLAMAFNTLRMRPDAGLQQFASERIKTLSAARGATSTVNYLIQQGRQDLADAVSSGTITPKEALSLIKKTSLQEKMELFQTDPELASKMAQAGLFGGDVDMGAGKWWDNIAQYTSEQIKQYNEAGSAASNLGRELDVISSQLAQIGETGPSAELKAGLQEFFQKFGVDIGAADLSSAQSLQAATRRLVSQELRLNAGPQTDFDAQYAESYIPSLGKMTQANQQMLEHMRSSNQIKQILAQMARQAQLADNPQQARKMVNEIDDLSMRTPSVVKRKDGVWVTFDKFSKLPEARGLTPRELLNEWVEFYKEEGGY